MFPGIKNLILMFSMAPLISCSLHSNNLDSETKRITVLHTNDNHGRFWQNANDEYGMPARKTLIDQLRSEARLNGNEVILLSGGDINTGIPESDMQQAEPDFKGMSLIGYDAMAIGNHEFDNPLSVLDKQQEWANFPLLSANIYTKGSNTLRFKPYKIFNKGNIKIAVIGLTTTDTVKIGNPEYISHLEFRDPELVSKTLLEKIKQEHQPDITIAVTHMGHYANAESGINAPGDVSLARNLPQGLLDIIIGGHSQEPVCMEELNVANREFQPGDACKPDQQNNTWIMQAHEWGKYVGKAEFELKNGTLTLVDYQLIPVNLKKNVTLANGKVKRELSHKEIKQDPQLLAFLAPFQEKGQAELSGEISHVNGLLNGDRNHVRFQQTNLGRLIARAQMEKVNADFGVISGGGIRDSISPGKVSYKDVLTVHPFKNRLTYIDMKGTEIMQFLNVVASFPPNAGAYTQFYGVSLVLKNGIATQIKINNAPLDLNKTYRFSLNSYNAAGGDGYPKLDTHPGFVATNFIDADILKDFLIKNNPLDVSLYTPNNEISYQ